jgi:hypothetical protein
MDLFLDDPRVALVHDATSYAKTSPYHPGEHYPEWPGIAISTENNPAYRAVRRILYSLDLDRQWYGTANWNPLREIVVPGNTVILKPNLVSHRNGIKGPSGASGIQLAIRDHRLGRAVLHGDVVSERVVDESSIDCYRKVDLDRRSELIEVMIGNWAFGCSQYSKRRMRAAHTPETNKYLIHHCPRCESS